MKELQVNKELPIINMNFDEVKESLKDTMRKYEDIIVTEEGLKDCKATQKNLARLRNNIDGYRKAVKKEMEAPIKSFEGQCKELISLISDVERPIKEGIQVYDDKRREEKKEKAFEIIKIAIKKFELGEEFSCQLNIKDSYLKLNGSIKSIKEDVEMRAMMLKREQEDKKTRIKMLEVAVKNEINRVNEKINNKLKYSNFESYVIRDSALDNILAEINKQAQIIEITESNVTKETVTINKEKESLEINTEEKVNKDAKKINDQYFVEFKVQHNFEMIQSLSKFLKMNGFKYDVISKGKV